MARIMCAMPTRSTPHPAAFNAMLNAAVGHSAEIAFPPGAPRDENRRRIVRAFLDKPEAEYLLFVDDDTVIPRDALDKLLAVGKPIVVGVQPLHLMGVLVVNISERLPGLPDEGIASDWPSWHTWDATRAPFPIKACGFGCVLIHRSALELIGDPWFREHYGDAYGHKSQTEDIWFCREAQKHGIELWVQPAVMCGHMKTVDLRDFVPWSVIETKPTEAIAELAKLLAAVREGRLQPSDIPAEFCQAEPGPLLAPECVVLSSAA